MSIRIKPWKDNTDEFQVVRWKYDPSQQRAVPSRLGRFKTNWAELPQPLVSTLEPDELVDLEAFWTETKNGQKIQRMQKLPELTKILIDEIAQAIELDALPTDDFQKIIDHLDDAKKLISKKIEGR